LKQLQEVVGQGILFTIMGTWKGRKVLKGMKLHPRGQKETTRFVLAMFFTKMLLSQWIACVQ
jgi:hypothetical protein